MQLNYSPARRNAIKTLYKTAQGIVIMPNLHFFGSMAANRKKLNGSQSDNFQTKFTPSKSNESVDAWLTLPPTPNLPTSSYHGMAGVNGTMIFFACFGSGPPVILLHGGLANSNYWGFQVAALAQNYTVIVMDTRGHGRSPMPLGPFSYITFANDVAGLMNCLNIPTAAIVGWSDGAITALQLSVSFPYLVSSIFAFGANVSVSGIVPDGANTQVFHEFIDRARKEYQKISPTPEDWAMLESKMDAVWGSGPDFSSANLQMIRLPVTISDGQYDEIIKSSETRFIAQQIPSSNLVIQSNVSHFAMIQDPLQFNEVLAQFLIRHQKT